MRKILLKNLAEFREWQRLAIKGIDDMAQRQVSLMAPPFEYPTILVWSFKEELDNEARFPNEFVDKLEHKYIYIGDFPVRHLKRGTYAYQIFQTSDCADI